MGREEVEGVDLEGGEVGEALGVAGRDVGAVEGRGVGVGVGRGVVGVVEVGVIVGGASEAPSNVRFPFRFRFAPRSRFLGRV